MLSTSNSKVREAVSTIWSIAILVRERKGNYDFSNIANGVFDSFEFRCRTAGEHSSEPLYFSKLGEDVVLFSSLALEDAFLKEGIEDELQSMKEAGTLLHEKVGDATSLAASNAAAKLMELERRISLAVSRLEKTERETSDLQNETRHRLSLSLEDNSNEFSAALKRAEADVKEVLEKIRTTEDQAKQIAGSMSTGFMTETYGKYGNDEKNSANLYRVISIVMMVIVAVVFGVIFAMVPKPEPYQIVSRFFLGAIMLIPVYYTARESAKHRAQQQLYLRTSMDLTASAPYIATLPTEVGNALKAEFAARIFFTQVPPDSQDSLPPSLPEWIAKAMTPKSEGG